MIETKGKRKTRDLPNSIFPSIPRLSLIISAAHCASQAPIVIIPCLDAEIWNTVQIEEQAEGARNFTVLVAQDAQNEKEQDRPELEK